MPDVVALGKSYCMSPSPFGDVYITLKFRTPRHKGVPEKNTFLPFPPISGPFCLLERSKGDYHCQTDCARDYYTETCTFEINLYSQSETMAA